MTALASTQLIPHVDRVPRLLGLRPVVAKEIHEWFANHRAPMLFAVTTLMMVLSTLSARIAAVCWYRMAPQFNAAGVVPKIPVIARSAWACVLPPLDFTPPRDAM